jgi:hypothetical protein
VARSRVRVQIETGSKRVFASAMDWPGWSRGGTSAADALAALHEYGPRYKRWMGASAKALVVPKTDAGYDVVARVKGDASTDFGMPSKPMRDHDEPLSAAELKTLVALLRASWRAFDRAAAKAAGHTLATGPRGGGRSLAKMRDHYVDGERSYLAKVGGTVPKGADVKAVRAEMVDAIGARARGELPERGPRGGARWSARQAVHRSAWHALDHAWEIEDRLVRKH